MIKMINLLKLTSFIFSVAFIGLPTIAQAQMSAPGSSGGTSVYDVLNEAEKAEKDRIEGSKGTDTGDNYGAGNAAIDAITDSYYNDIKNTASDAIDKYKEADTVGGKISAALGGVLKTGVSASLATFRAAFSFFDNLSISGDIYEYVDPSTGETIKYTKTIFGGAAAIKGNMKGCPPIPIAIADASSCTFCPLFAVLYGAAQEMAELSFGKLARPMAMVMLVGFAIYIAFKVLAYVSSFTRKDAPSFINELLIQSFKVLLAFLFLMNPEQIYYYFISPVLGAGLEFGAAMLFQPSEMAQQCVGMTVENDTALLPVTLYAKLDCYIRSVQSEIAVNQAIGSSLMCVGRHAAAGKIAGFWDFNMVFQGLFIWGFSLMLSLAFAFFLIDAIVSLGIIGALMPFLIACWPFKITTKYSKTGIEMFLNIFFTFVFVGIVVSINTQLIGQAMNNSASTTSSSDVSSSDVSNTAGGLGTLAQALSGDDIEKVKELTDLGFSGFLILIFCCIFGFKFSGQASTLANKMAGGAGINLARDIGGMATKGTTNIARRATQPARQAIVNKAGELTSRAGNAVMSKLGLGKYGGKTGGKSGNNLPKPAGGGAGGNGGNNLPKPAGSGTGGGAGGGDNTNTHNQQSQNRQFPTGGDGNKDDLRKERNNNNGGGAAS